MTKKLPARAKRAPKAVLTAATRVERKLRRAVLGSLNQLRVTKSTLRRYALAYGSFAHFMCQVICGTITDWIALDTYLSWHIEALWGEGEPRPWANDVCAAVQ